MEDEAVVVFEYRSQMPVFFSNGDALNFGGRPFIFKSKQDDAPMKAAISLDFLSEILIISDQNPTFI